MTRTVRQTICPLCGSRLGAMVDEQWVPMPLDQYREHAAMRLARAAALPNTCVACGTPRAFEGMSAL